MRFTEKGIYLFASRPGMGTNQFFFNKFRSGLFLSLRSTFDNKNYIDYINENPYLFSNNLEKYQLVALQKYGLQSALKNLYLYPQEAVFFSYFNGTVLERFKQNTNLSFNEIALILKYFALTFNKTIILNYYLPDSFDNRKNVIPNQNYFLKQKIDIQLFEEAYWFYREKYYNPNAEHDILEVRDIKSFETYIY